MCGKVTLMFKISRTKMNYNVFCLTDKSASNAYSALSSVHLAVGRVGDSRRAPDNTGS